MAKKSQIMEKKRVVGKKKEKIKRMMTVSFLPSVFTTANLFLGFLALLQIIKGNFLIAVYLITAAAVMDGFDGTIARLMKSESEFGFHLDSLVDAVSFGLVGAMLVYFFGFQTYFPQIGKVISFVFLSAGVFRLARFNVLKDANAGSTNIFIGLPIPIACVAIGSGVLILQAYQMPQRLQALIFAAYSILISLLMISNIPYRTVKKIAFRNNLRQLFVMAFCVAFLIMYPYYAIPLLTISYLMSPLLFLLLVKKVPAAEKTNEQDGDTAAPDG